VPTIKAIGHCPPYISLSCHLPTSLKQNATADILRERANKKSCSLYAPGHKRGQGIPQQLADCFGSAVFRADLPELAELDNFYHRVSSNQLNNWQQQRLGLNMVLVNGSTCGVEAAILATCTTGDKLSCLGMCIPPRSQG